MTTNPQGFTDAIGRRLEINDIVMATFGGHSSLFRMQVVGFTAKKIRLKAFRKIYATSGRSGSAGPDETNLRDSDCMIIINTGDGRVL